MNKKLLFWNVIFISSLLMANILAGKVTMLFSFVVPAAWFSYGITFLCTDVIDELWGKEQANLAVKYGFIAQIFASILILIGQFLPVAPFAIESQEAYVTLLGQNWRFVLASLTAYYISQRLDVWLFNKIHKKTNGKHKWLRNNASTMISQLIDTLIFITIAFYGVVPNLFMMIVGQYVVKFSMALLDTPVFYLITRKDK